jgi:hypothetical protein
MPDRFEKRYLHADARRPSGLGDAYGFAETLKAGDEVYVRAGATADGDGEVFVRQAPYVGAEGAYLDAEILSSEPPAHDPEVETITVRSLRLMAQLAGGDESEVDELVSQSRTIEGFLRLARANGL